MFLSGLVKRVVFEANCHDTDIIASSGRLQVLNTLSSFPDIVLHSFGILPQQGFQSLRLQVATGTLSNTDMISRVQSFVKGATTRPEPRKEVQVTDANIGQVEKGDGEVHADYGARAGFGSVAERKAAEKRLLRKQDAVILTFAIFSYIFANLDRGNLGSSRLLGLETEVLGGDDLKFSLALCCFFFSYMTFAIPGTIAAKHFNPSFSLGCAILLWGVAASAQAAVKNPASLYVCRLFLGIGEACFATGMVLYLTMWYTPNELAKRFGLCISTSALAGAFGGLIAYGVAKIDQPAIPRFSILFLSEGLPTIIFGFLVFFAMPSRPAQSKFLTEEERHLSEVRLRECSNFEESDGIDWNGVRRGFTDWKTWATASMYTCVNFQLGSVAGFLPTIVKEMGYSNASAQLFTVPPYIVALVFTLLMTSYSDRAQRRGAPLAATFLIGSIGWVILARVDPRGSAGDLRARYTGIVFIVMSGYAALPLTVSWVSRNNPAESQRAVGLGALNVLGHFGSIGSAFLFPSKQAPWYEIGTAVNIAAQVTGLAAATSMSYYFYQENKRRDRVEGKPELGQVIDTRQQFDKAPGFRFVC